MQVTGFWFTAWWRLQRKERLRVHQPLFSCLKTAEVWLVVSLRVIASRARYVCVDVQCETPPRPFSGGLVFGGWTRGGGWTRTNRLLSIICYFYLGGRVVHLGRWGLDIREIFRRCPTL